MADLTTVSVGDPNHAQIHNDERTAINSLPGPADVDNVSAQSYIEQPTGDSNGFVVKVNAAAPSGYGHGQAFMVLKAGVGDATDDTATGSILFRIDEIGGVGLTGGLHVATGLRQDAVGGMAVWIDPAEDVIPLLIHNASVAESAAWASDYIRVVNTRTDPDANVMRLDSNGSLRVQTHVVARDGANDRVRIGSTFGLAGIAFGPSSSEDTFIYRADAGVVGIVNMLDIPEVADPVAPGANKGRLFVRDNGAGKSQLCVRFNTGAVQVIATEP